MHRGRRATDRLRVPLQPSIIRNNLGQVVSRYIDAEIARSYKHCDDMLNVCNLRPTHYADTYVYRSFV